MLLLKGQLAFFSQRGSVRPGVRGRSGGGKDSRLRNAQLLEAIRGYSLSVKLVLIGLMVDKRRRNEVREYLVLLDAGLSILGAWRALVSDRVCFGFAHVNRLGRFSLWTLLLPGGGCRVFRKMTPPLDIRP